MNLWNDIAPKPRESWTNVMIELFVMAVRHLQGLWFYLYII